MAYFEWAADLVIDNGPIDVDHQHLVNMVNELHTATSQGSGQEVVGQLLDQLLSDTEQHITREEQIMAALKFPRLDAHQREHQKFVAELHALQKKYAQGSLTTASQLSTLLRDWLSLHIRRSDREIRDFLTARRAGR
ncbi:MAG: hemerythrin family protein [Burkholderiales bacterium]|nr:hemerythrin family protein [Burkholderiales bacterium]